MALEQNDIRYDVDIDLQDSLREIDQLRHKLKSFSDNLAVSATDVQKNMRKAAEEYVSYIRKLESELKSLKKQGQDTSAHEARLSQIRNRQRSAPTAIARDYAQGSTQSQANRAVFQREINEMKATTNQLVGKYFDELNATYLRSVKRSLTNLQNEERILRTRMDERNFRAQHGDAAYGFMKQSERRNLNGGANQFLSQAGILNNYAMVGGAYTAAFSLGNFIVQLDAQFKQFQAITASTNGEMAVMEDRLLSVAEKTKFTANEIAEAATLMGQAGMSAGEVAEAIEPVSKLATAAGTELKNAVDVVTSALNIFNLQTGEAGHLADVFTAALNESKLTLDQLTAALQYAGNTAATVGISYNELTAAVGALANAGIRSGSTIGTGLRQLLVDLTNPSKNLIAELSRLGLSMEDIDLKTHGLSGVLQNLKDAGFDTSSAFEGLEVRAAAAFTALSNNLDTMSELRQSFLLSNAAAEANETQMESLANTAKNFGSNLGALVYTAFGPFLRTLQNTVAVASDVIASLREMGPLVEIVGTAFATLASAFVLVRLGKLAAGLIGIGAAATGAAGAMGLLRAATLGNPLFLGATVLITGLQLLSHYADRAGRVQAALDQLKTEQNEYQASVDHTNDRISSLSAAMDDLVRKQKSLDGEGSEVLRKTKIMEVLSTFQELTGGIDASTASVADLIKAMQNLKAEMLDGLPDQFGLLVDKIDQRLEVLRQAAADQARGDSWFMASMGASKRFDNGGAVYPDQTSVFNDKVAQQFGQDVAEAFLIASNQKLQDEVGGQRAQALATILERQIAATQRKIKPLDERSGVLGVGGDLSDVERNQLVELRKDLNFLTTLKQSFDPLSKYLTQIEAEQSDRGIQVSKQAKASFGKTAGYESADRLKTETTGFLTNRLGEIISSDLPIEETKKAYDELETELNARIGKINESLKAAAEEMRQSGQFTESEINKALDDSAIKEEIAGLQGAFKKGAEGSITAFKKFQAYMIEQEQKNVERQIASTRKQLSDAQNERQVDLLENQLYELDTKLAKLERDAFDVNPDKNVGDNDADLELAKRKIRDDQKNRRDDLVGAVIEKRADLAKKVNEVFDDNLNDQLKRVQDEMTNLAQSIDNNSTEQHIRTVKQKLDELNEKAKQLAGQIASISVADDFGSFALGGLPTASAGDIQRRIIEAANKAGIPPEIALALASFESGFDPSAKNPNPGASAAGIYQNTDANWASHGLTAGDRSSVEMQIYAGIQDMLRTQKELGTTQLSFKDYYGSHLLGQTGYKNVKNNPNVNAVELLGSEVVSGNGGNINQTASEFLDMVVSKAAQHLQKVKGMVQRPLDAADDALQTQTDNLTEGARDAVRSAGEKIKKNQIKKTTELLDAQAQALEARINTLMVQSSKAQDPQAIQSIIDQVKTKWAEMAKKEVDAFTKENEDTDDFDTRLASLKDELNSGLSGKIVTLLDRYQQSIENMQFEPLLDAQARLEAAQNPLYANKYTDAQVQGMQHDVQLQQQVAQQERLNQLEQLHAYILQQVTAAEQQYGANSQMVQALKERQYSVEQSLTGVRRQATADTEAAAQGELSLKDAIEAANRAWMQRNGLMDNNGMMISSAQRIGQAWGQMLDGVSNSMSTLFMDLASGSMSAEEAFKKFGLSVVQMLMQMIAKALVFNMLQGLMGGGGGGGGFLGMIFGGGAATGQYISGVKRAAGGEYIHGSAPFRDSQLRMVQPGEMILRTSAVNQIGRDALEKVNALGNRRISAGMPSVPAPQPADQRPVNVWAVLPEEKPQVGPDDVVAYISDDIRRRGVTRTLIKAINSGKI
ncbi:MAG: phage tail tape measure protein [Mesorhizobium sp.]|uniref:phage tail tape measure protein n=2 Tax=Mesorhizobium sp. TaxID=1871066 RepID=UPI000FE2C754|nr:phage tail tape measure protein [Mesorhizobium sp.]RWI88171.1 MAG: phage tail tape measure protein [Mesorhizobium sp.]RWJ10584.1 MAG: phage tail tape measure protein [Mesorhizobium sp.]RWJ17856.1 MAG: phage tail tape measure protein [Mesorhizobium sp.]RWJ60071.1 MAG: phage tail tape measure protein [Mesorhizobium sp.]RWJ74321.1 MAG: phage tail tape measure protein [Mesorhizobium sp.]